jgi:hypothetical protein
MLNYSSIEPDSIDETSFRFRKEFTFDQLPNIKCRILLRDKILKHVYFGEDITFDPYRNAYIIGHPYHKGVEKYYRGNALDIMQPIIEKIIKAGWEPTP